MQIKQKQFDEIWNKTSVACRHGYKIECTSKVKFIAEVIFEKARKKNFFAYVECGVWRGMAFLPIFHFCKALFSDFAMYAVDSFSGFPKDSVGENDEFKKFEMMFKEGMITKAHLQRARERIFTNPKRKHLEKEYFSSSQNEFFQRCKGKDNIHIIKGSFSELKANFTNNRDWYDLVLLDCDLHLSYKHCLEFFKNKTNLFIFDEYYSLKYPGPRIACDEFIKVNLGWKLFKKIETYPYFERWGIRKEA